MNVKFVDYEIKDDGVVLHLVADDPGPGQPNDIYLQVTDEELKAAPQAEQVLELVKAKLERKLKATGLLHILDKLTGIEIVVDK